ncbi:hypothetical protein [Porphyromonas circumdentaria]|uniref:hypothetical protein n=1 Tax=Porphyromonas circumdentaria TaxID=29524 RepID=UPI0026DDC8B9|nr:hypothetical protein [Porphyromonas circumdentaria]MDO4722410.1 hypothetical protein [Porphyromonas circumdentaria]
MKKIVVLLLGLFGWMQIASAQIFDRDTMEEVNERWGFDCKLGVLGVWDFMPRFSPGFSFIYRGFYGDFLISAPSHMRDARIGKWQDKRSISFHLGYQIPFTEAFRIVPVLGHTFVATGITDGYDWIAGSGGIENKFSPTKTVGGLDYGAVFVYNFMWRAMDMDLLPINLSLTVTRYGLYGGIGCEF